MDIFQKYDLVDIDEKIAIPELPDEGLIFVCGSSGSGKSTILKKWFKQNRVGFDNKPIYQNFSSPENAEKLLISCGLRTIPAWKRSYKSLSNGEKHRAYCALLLDNNSEYIDEFTSVVDRNTAKALSYAIQKYYKKNNVKRLCIASCHTDIIRWLNPDYIYRTDTKTWTKLPRDCLWRPKIKLSIRACGTHFWEIFKKHHYLSGKINKSANCFVALFNDMPIGFCSVLSFPNGHFKNGWREHRTVVLPEFQGMGIGTNLSDCIAEYIVSLGYRFFSKTSHPAFGLHRENSLKWKPTSKNKKNREDYKCKTVTKEDKHKLKHQNRVCYSHEYIGNTKGNI